MIALDTNVLVYAHRKDAKFHAPAAALLRGLAEGAASWSIPWPCVHEFYSIVTHRRIYAPPSTPDQAVSQLDAWLNAPSVTLLREPAGHWPQFQDLLRAGELAGPVIHDARIAAICIAHGVSELITLDRDFSRFPALTTRGLLTLPLPG